MKKSVLTFALALTSLWTLAAEAPKYVILFIGDGMSTPQRMIAEEFSRKAGRGSLAMNDMPFQATTRTCSASSLVTDSAAAATAIACGAKTDNGKLGVDPKCQPVYSCALAAKEAGKKVGICTTVTITHATPGGFYAHRANRGDSYGIAIDLVNSGFDFFAGGGFSVNPKNEAQQPEYKKYGEAYAYAVKEGYKEIKTKKEFMALKPGCGKIFTHFTNEALENTIDVEPSMDQPTIAEITSKAIECLDNPQGFFLMVEGGRIDWAGHANDAATNLRDVLALDDAVKVALKFLAAHPKETLVVVTGDHETGGMSMGFAETGYALYMERLANQTMSIGKFDGKMHEAMDKAGKKGLSFDKAKPLITEAFGFKFTGNEEKDPMVLKPAELEEIKKAFEHDIAFRRSKIEENSKYDGEKRYLLGLTCRLIISHKAGIGWSSGAHTAMPVLTTAKGCGSELFSGFIENTGIADRLKSFYAAK